MSEGVRAVANGLFHLHTHPVRPPCCFCSYKYHNVTRVDSFSTGGHFAAFEVPDLLVASLRGFLRDAGL